MQDEAMLGIEDAHTYYGEGYVLQGVSLRVRAGAVVSVLGRNGAGKTTLVRTVIAFTPARRGRVVFAGEDITRLPSHAIARRGMGIVPQGRRVFPSLTVRENLEIARRRPGSAHAGKVWDLEGVSALFPRLKERWSNRASTLSGGEQQMLAVARALVSNPRCLLMDEPSEGLSPRLVEELGQLILRLKQEGLPILLVEQNLGFAVQVSDHVHVMDKGRIVFESTPAALLENEGVKRTYLGL
jgi:branched-chain amino acid transport system ATP-binding protein